VKPKTLSDDALPFPFELQHIWQWFDELSHARASNGFALMPIGWAEIHAWAVLTGAEPEPWEVRVLVRLDAAYRSVVAEAAAKRDKQQPKPKAVR
jgi:hypothetical protein